MKCNEILLNPVRAKSLFITVTVTLNITGVFEEVGGERIFVRIADSLYVSECFSSSKSSLNNEHSMY